MHAAGSDFHADAGDSLKVVLDITESGPEFPKVRFVGLRSQD